MYIPSSNLDSTHGLNPGIGCCGGMGALMDGTGLLGTGLFASGSDLSGWGRGEAVVVAFGLFTVYSLFSTTGRGVQTVRRKARGALRA
jgi:hypothetical protein